MELTDVILCFGCRYEVTVAGTTTEEVTLEELKGVLKSFRLCPKCGLPLTKEKADGNMVLMDQNAVVVPSRHAFSPVYTHH